MEMLPNPEGEGGEIALLSDVGLHGVKNDCKLITAAIKHGWPVPVGTRRTAVARLTSIIRKPTVTVPCGESFFDSAYHADGNAIAAARVLVAMEGQNQADRHIDDKNARLDAGHSTENVAHAVVVKGVDTSLL